MSKITDKMTPFAPSEIEALNALYLAFQKFDKIPGGKSEPEWAEMRMHIRAAQNIIFARHGTSAEELFGEEPGINMLNPMRV